MGKGNLVPLEPMQQHKHNYIKTFFRINIERLLAIYRSLNGSEELNAENWHRYVNSKELFDCVYPLMRCITPYTRNAIANSEPIEQLGDEMLTERFETYHAMSFELHDNITRPDMELFELQHATRCFITALNHMFFKYLYKGSFVIFRGGTIRICLNDDLEYEFVE